jgi:4-hydroxybenzoate polyprenyltransferase
MIRRLRLVLIVARPPVALLLGLYAAIGLAQAGHGEDRLLLLRVLVVVCCLLLFSVACNDIADQEIDRVNLAGNRGRPLVTGAGGPAELVVIGSVAAMIALVVAATLGWWVTGVAAAGLLLSACYSLRPVRVADRGVAASLLLPACYVAVPYLVGYLATGVAVRPSTPALLAGLYIGFIGRILLKDFRDVRGDALFGKRTFLVRHGRRWTCGFSAVCLTVGGAVLLLAVPAPTPALVAGYVLGVAAVLVSLRMLAADPGHRREEALIAAIAIVGRGMLLLVLAHLAMTHAGWPPAGYDAVLAGLVLITAGQAVSMARHGPHTRITVATGPVVVDE